MAESKFFGAGYSLIGKFPFICFVFITACKNGDYRIRGNEDRFRKLICYYDSLSNIHPFYLEYTSNVTNFAIDNKVFDSEIRTEKEIASEFEKNGIRYNSIQVLISKMKALGVLSIGKNRSSVCDYISLGIRDAFYDRQMQYVIHQNFYSNKKCEPHSFPTTSKEISRDVYLFKGKSPFE
ncbi:MULTISPECIES: hypothetical protein [Niastella]|uniref:Lipoprotein n=1 Tax=Niastella soli TaxID=2821487 RepID=A0ABS3Z1F8_9BACT|nr:hypothetical protein [Niastella soli]MBO9203231.1 hypothetical protein [Niastella soli]